VVLHNALAFSLQSRRVDEPMMRTVLLRLSRNEKAREAFTHYKFMQRAARRFVAGQTLEEALSSVRELNELEILATLDHLGENVTSEAEARAAQAEYLQVLDHIAQTRVRSNVSLKLTQMGLDVSDALCAQLLRAIVSRAQLYENFVRIDMEGSAYTDRTLRLYEALRDEGYANVGVVIQSYLYRSANDVERLIERGANVRLCKGAYQEPPSLAFPQKSDVDANYQRLLERITSEEAQRRGIYVAIATHDAKLIEWAKRLAEARKIPRERFEFQMLYGIRRDLQQQLVRAGYRVRVYVSYGTHWYPYFMRRLAERPANLFFLLRNVLRG
jgi:proline dehydrogenase